ncbi:MAG: stage V sporulation protein AE [Bacilli bacterium]
MTKKRVIVVTDGDEYALRAVERAARELGCRVISASQSNPTMMTGKEIAELVMKTPYDPVIVLFDDSGFVGMGPGERALSSFATMPNIEIIGALAVASRTCGREWSHVDVSIDRDGNLTEFGVDKYGLPDINRGRISGDTVDVLDKLNIPIVVGIGDIGKMHGHDLPEAGAKITHQALELILERNGIHASGSNGEHTVYE